MKPKEGDKFRFWDVDWTIEGSDIVLKGNKEHFSRKVLLYFNWEGQFILHEEGDEVDKGEVNHWEDYGIDSFVDAMAEARDIAREFYKGTRNEEYYR